MAITAIQQSAYNTQVKLSDNSVVPLSDFLRAPGGRTIVGYLNGAYNAQVRTSAGASKGLAEHVRAPGGAEISNVLAGGYGGTVIANGAPTSLADFQQAEEAAI